MVSGRDQNPESLVFKHDFMMLVHRPKYRSASSTAATPVRSSSRLPIRTRSDDPLTSRDLISSRQTALETAQLLYRFVGSARYNSIEQLLEQIRTVGKRLVAANPKGMMPKCRLITWQ